MPSYTYLTDRTSPNQSARPAGAKITSITIHHWGATGQRFDSVVNYLCRKGGNSSAHYVVEDGRVACIVAPDRRAWHAGNNTGNNTSIGIECRPEATDGDYATVAELIRELRAAYGDLPLKRHSDWKATACPGRWDLGRLDALARGGAVPVSKPAPAPAPAPSGIAVDGHWGPATTKALQARFGTSVDGVISGQKKGAWNAGVNSARWGNGGSQLIAAMQRWLAIPADGYLGPQTVRALQARMGTPVDGVISAPSQAVAEMQRRLNAGTL